MDATGIAGQAALKAVGNAELAKQAGTVFDKMFPYFGRKKKALDIYDEEIEKSNLSPEAKIVAVLNAKKNIKQMVNQARVAQIAMESAKAGTDFSIESKVNPEWLERYMDSAGYVTSEEVQQVWGRILAKEFEAPGTTPLNMRRILSEITPEYASLFRVICSMKVQLCDVDDMFNENDDDKDNVIVSPYTNNELVFRDMGLSYEVLNELETLGLIRFNDNGYRLQIADRNLIAIRVGDLSMKISVSNDRYIPVGNVLLTSAGKALERITPSSSVTGYDQLIMNYYKHREVI